MPAMLLRLFPSPFRGAGLAFLVVLICFCVASQMLGTPTTLMSLLTADASMESVSEDFSIPAVLLEGALASGPLLYERTHSSLYHLIFETLAFHPPQT